jgi:hypothetical protein
MPPVVRAAERRDDVAPLHAVPVLGSAFACLFQDRASSGQPAALHSPITQDVPTDPGEHPRCPSRAEGVAILAIGGVGPLVVINGSGVVALEVQSLAQAFLRLSGLNVGEHVFEGSTGG